MKIRLLLILQLSLIFSVCAQAQTNESNMQFLEKITVMIMNGDDTGVSNCSGILVNKRHVLTANHCVNRLSKEKITIRTTSGHGAFAKVVESKEDIAILEIDREYFTKNINFDRLEVASPHPHIRPYIVGSLINEISEEEEIEHSDPIAFIAPCKAISTSGTTLNAVGCGSFPGMSGGAYFQIVGSKIRVLGVMAWSILRTYQGVELHLNQSQGTSYQKLKFFAP